jgi:hypothetical protein
MKHKQVGFGGSSGCALAGYGLLAALFYAPVLLGLRTFPDGDFTHHFLPFTLWQLESWRAGELPLWNPYTYAGHPFLADTQAALFYPISNLLLVLSWPLTTPGARLYILQVEAVIQVALAGFFVYLLLQELVQDRWAAFTAGCCFAFSGYLTGYPPLQLAVLRTAIWLPLVWWLLWRGAQCPGQWRWWMGAGVAYACTFLAGHPQTFLHSSYAIAAWILLLWLDRAQSAKGTTNQRFLPLVLGLLAFAGLALGLSAAQWLPSLEFTRLSVRVNVDYVFVSGGFPLQDTWQLLLPGVLTQFSPLYIGIIGLGFVFLGVQWSVISRLLPVRSLQSPVSSLQSPVPNLQSPISNAPYPIFFLLLTLMALLLSYGGNGFLYPLYYAYAPGWNLFRGQERAAYLVALGLSVLAGYGAAVLPHLPLRLRRGLALLFLAGVTIGVYSFGLLWQLLGRSAISQWRYLVIALISLLLAGGWTVLLRVEGWSKRRAWGLTGLVVLNLLWANGATNLASFGAVRKTILAPEMAAIEQAVQERNASNLGLPGRTYNEFRVYENYGIRSHLEEVWGSSPLRLARYAALFGDFPLDRMWRLLGVEHVLTWRRELFEPSSLLGEFPQTTDTTFLHRLSDTNPRAWLVQQVQSVEDGEARRRLADHQFDLERIALLPAEAYSGTLGSAGPTPATIQLVRRTANRLHVAVTSEQGGLLVISENWLPGWRAENPQCEGSASCTGSPLFAPGLPLWSVQRTNLTLIGVPVAPGAVHFELVYWPESVRSGLWISGVTLGGLLLVALWRFSRRRQRTSV